MGRRVYWHFDISTEGVHLYTHIKPADVETALKGWAIYDGIAPEKLIITVKHMGKVVGRHNAKEWYDRDKRDFYSRRMWWHSRNRAEERKRTIKRLAALERLLQQASA